jgi:hypothetical protein
MAEEPMPTSLGWPDTGIGGGADHSAGETEHAPAPPSVSSIPPSAMVVPFCLSVTGTVGGWTIVAAEIALGLHELVFIKDLIDAATAKSAKELQGQADNMTEDAKNAGSMALQIGMASVMEAGGEALGGTKFGQALGREATVSGVN